MGIFKMEETSEEEKLLRSYQTEMGIYHILLCKETSQPFYVLLEKEDWTSRPIYMGRFQFIRNELSDYHKQYWKQVYEHNGLYLIQYLEQWMTTSVDLASNLIEHQQDQTEENDRGKVVLNPLLEQEEEDGVAESGEERKHEKID